MVVENTIYCIGGIGGKGGTYEKRLDTVNQEWKQSFHRQKKRLSVTGGVLAAGGGGGEAMETACKHVHTKIFTHMRGDVLSKLLDLNVCKVLSKIPLLGDGRADLCCGRWRWERLALFGRGILPTI